MGAIMAIGVAVANAILLVTFAEQARRHGGSPLHTAIDAARARMRPVLMTSAAMIAGMMPMALALGEGAEATAPLGRAVIGGLAAATLATLDRAAVGVLAGAAVGERRVAVARSGRSGERVSRAGNTHERRHRRARASVACSARLASSCRSGCAACGGDGAGRSRAGRGAPGRRRSRSSASSSSRSTCTLSLPGELNPYQTVAIYPRVTGFVKTIRVDRGSRVRAGELLAALEAPELVAQRAEAQSKLQARRSAARPRRASKADADASTYDKLKAAAATPGVVAGNDVRARAEGGRGRPESGRRGAAERRSGAAGAATSVSEMEGYLQSHGAVRRRRDRAQRPSRRARRARAAARRATPMVRLVENDRLRLVVPVPEAYTAGMTRGTEMPFTVAAYPGQTFSGTVARIAQAVDVNTRTMAVELDVDNGDGRLAPGTFCQVRWPVRRIRAVAVRAERQRRDHDRPHVRRPRPRRQDGVGRREDRAHSGPLVEVFGDLRAGDEIAARGTDEMRPGTEVRPRESQAGDLASPSGIPPVPRRQSPPGSCPMAVLLRGRACTCRCA